MAYKTTAVAVAENVFITDECYECGGSLNVLLATKEALKAIGVDFEWQTRDGNEIGSGTYVKLTARRLKCKT